jgi:predicted DNA binding CopG/RHH family protein
MATAFSRRAKPLLPGSRALCAGGRFAGGAGGAEPLSKKLLEQLDTKKLPPLSPEWRKMFREAAVNFVSGETSMSIRMDARELEELRKQATGNGLKCQFFIKAVLHKYITGQLVEKNAC